MGEVWLVHDHELDERVVAKIVPQGASEEAIDLLRREYRQARRLAHPNVVRVFDFHHSSEYSFITMAHVEGHDLGRFRGRSPAEIIDVILPVVEALIHAHEQGVVHRDLKPSNVRCDADGRPQLLDFGIAGVLDRKGESSITGGGTGHYASPQQLGGNEPDPADDLYGLGALLFDLIGGTPPDGPVQPGTPDALRSAYPLPGRVRELVSSLLSADPGERPQSMRDVRAELLELRQELARATPVTKQAVRVMPPPRVKAVRALSASKPSRAAAASGAPRRWAYWMTGAVIVALMLVAAGVFLFLPGWLEERRIAEQSSPRQVTLPESDPESDAPSAPGPAGTGQPPAPDPEELGRQAFHKERAEEALETALNVKAVLEERAVLRWGGDDYAAALASMSTADDQLTTGRYAEAADSYTEAARRMEVLAARAPDVFRRALEQGRSALVAGDSTAAAAAFGLAAAMVPDNPAAATGLQRAGVLDRVLDLLAAGVSAERRGDLARAEENYRGAVALDALYQPAQAALARVLERVSNDAFAQAMSEGLEALERRDYPAARAAFQTAESVEPGSPQVADALAQVEQAVKLETIFELREQASAAVAAEDWHAAVRHFTAVLELDPAIRFAQEGKARAASRAALSDSLEFHLDNPDRLSSDDVLRDASELLADASAIEPAGPRLSQQIQDLGALLQVSAIPVRVRLESDNLTRVTVYKVGALGTFEQHELELRPGKYTVVGSRKGYRDVRRQLVVEPGEEVTLVVRCEEKI
jgi:tetratricopeptide (TPR) repeat protein